MKPQDIIFFLILLGLLYFRNTKYFVIAGIASLVIAIPLFAQWVFFTGERLTWYAAAFFLAAIILSFLRQQFHKTHDR